MRSRQREEWARIRLDLQAGHPFSCHLGKLVRLYMEQPSLDFNKGPSTTLLHSTTTPGYWASRCFRLPRTRAYITILTLAHKSPISARVMADVTVNVNVNANVTKLSSLVLGSHIMSFSAGA